MKFYKKTRFRKFEYFVVSISIILLPFVVYLLLNDEDIDSLLYWYMVFYPVFIIINFISNRKIPYFEVRNDQLIKRFLFKSYTIDIAQIEYIKNVFGDIHIKGPDKIIRIEQNALSQEDVEKLCSLLRKQTQPDLA